MKRRLLSLALAMLLTLFAFSVSVFADDSDVGTDIENQYSMRFFVDTVAVGNDDETVQVNINVERNGGFAAMIYQIQFDKDVLSLEQQPTLGDLEGFEFTGGPLQQGKHIGMLVSEENVYGDGAVVTYTFKINPAAKSGTHEIELITNGVAELPDGGKIDLEIFDENSYPILATSTLGGITIPGYTVTYDANGGSGAPDSQIKDKNDSVRISSVIPERDGHQFLGWSTDKTASSVKYKAGDKYSENANLELYAVWKKLENVAGEIDIAVSAVEGKAGDEIEVVISVANNPGVGGMQFDVVFDETKLAYKTASVVSYDEESGITLDSFMFTKPNIETVTNKLPILLLANVENLVGDGDVLKITFEVLDDAEDGFTDVSVIPVEFFKYSGENMSEATLVPNITNGGVEIVSQLLGDIDLDEDVDIDDAILLFQYSMVPDIYPIDYKGNVDFTKDGEVGIDDAILLFQYSMLPDIYPIG